MDTVRHLLFGVTTAGLLTTAGCTYTQAAPPEPTYGVPVTVSGLAGSGLVLQDNGGDDLSVTSSGLAQFATLVGTNTVYDVTVKHQPVTPNQTCEVEDGSGVIGGADPSDIQVTCVTNTYHVIVAVFGLVGGGLVLQNNGGDDLSVSATGAAEFAMPIVDGGAYAVTVKSQPIGQTCVITNGSGTISGGDVTRVDVTCQAATT